MAILTPSQLVSASNATYFDNTSGSITPGSVRTLNTDWISSSILVDQTGSMSVASASVATSANTSVSSSYSATASVLLGSVVSASHADQADTASYALTASLLLGTIASASYATTSSYALNAELLDGLDSTSFTTTSSFNSFSASISSRTSTNETNITTLTNASASFAIASGSTSTRLTNLESWSSSLDNGYVTNAELNASSSALQAGVTSSINVATTNLQAGVTSSINVATTNLQAGVTSSINVAVSNLQAGVTASIAGFANTASNTFTGTNIFNVVTASFVKALSASIDYLSVVYQTSSVIFSSGSNVFGDNANDTQTLWGTVEVVTGPLNVTGSTRLQYLTASGLSYPTADGIVEQFLSTDGAGNLSFADVRTLYQNIRNREAVTINKGAPLYVSGSTGDNADVYLADASNPARMPASLIAGDTTLAAGAVGRGIILGHIEGVDTTGYPAGTEVFVAGGGGWTSTRPTGSAEVQALGVVTREGTNGMGIVLTVPPAILPNIAQGYTWVGDVNGVPQAVATSSINNVVSASFASTASFYGGSVTSASFASTASFVNTLNQDVVISGSVTVSQSILVDQVNMVRAGFSSNPFNHQPSSYLGSIRFGANNQDFYITNYNQGTTAEAFTSQSNVGLFLNTGSNFVRTYLHADMSNVSGYLNLENANGNLNLNTNARFTVSASNTMFQGPAGAGVGTWFQNRVLISGPSAGETPKLFISGSDGAFTDLGRGSNIINTTVASGIDASSQIFANPAKEAAQYIGVFTPDTFVDDVEHAIRVDVSGISFSDFDNGSAFDYVPYMTLAPNLGDNPAPVFTRGLVATGSVSGNVVSASISSNTSSLDFSQGNFFTSLVGSNTFFNVTSPKAGQTVNLLLTTSGAATASFSSNVKQVSGSAYTPTSGSGKNDILTFISWDGTSVYLANVKNLV